MINNGFNGLNGANARKRHEEKREKILERIRGKEILVTLAEIAAFYGASEKHIKRLIRNDGFPAERGADGVYRAVTESIVEYQKRRVEGGRKK